MRTSDGKYTGPRIHVRAAKQVCPRCHKSAWFHKRLPKRWVCRGDVTPAMMDAGLLPTSGYTGCGREYPHGSE